MRYHVVKNTLCALVLGSLGFAQNGAGQSPYPKEYVYLQKYDMQNLSDTTTEKKNVTVQLRITQDPLRKKFIKYLPKVSEQISELFLESNIGITFTSEKTPMQSDCIQLYAVDKEGMNRRFFSFSLKYYMGYAVPEERKAILFLQEKDLKKSEEEYTVSMVRVIAHEIGHLLSLIHTDDVNVMSTSQDISSREYLTFSSDQIRQMHSFLGNGKACDALRETPNFSIYTLRVIEAQIYKEYLENQRNNKP